MNFPFVHVAGDTLDMQVNVPQYPSSDGWTLKYRLTPRFTTPTQAPIDLTAISNADGSYQLQAGPTDTAAWKPGAYGWARWVQKTGARQTLTSSEDQGEVQIRQDPAGAIQGYDSRSHARKVLEAVEASLENRATTTQRELVEYVIGTRSMKYDIHDNRAALVQLRLDYLWFVNNEDAQQAIATGQPNPRMVGIRYGGR